MKVVKNIGIHGTFILAGVFIVLLILDNYNPTMNFLSRSGSVFLLWLYCVLTILHSGYLIVNNRRQENKKIR